MTSTSIVLPSRPSTPSFILNPASQAAEMACMRIFLITGTTSSPGPSLCLPPSPSIHPSFSSSPPPLFLLVYPAHLHTLGERGKLSAQQFFTLPSNAQQGYFRQSGETTGHQEPAGSLRTLRTLTHAGSPHCTVWTTPHPGKRSLKNKEEQNLCFLVERPERPSFLISTLIIHSQQGKVAQAGRPILL